MQTKARNVAHFFLAAFAALFLLSSAAEADFPALTGRVVDDAGILSQDAQDKLTALLAEHEQQTGNQVVVATVKSLDGDDIRDFGYKLGRAWGIGQKGKNNGVLILIAPNEHKADIEVGYGLEGTLTDEDSGLIIRKAMLPYFKKGDYDSGALAGTVMVLEALGGKPSNAASLPQPQDQTQDDSGGGGFPSFIVIVILFLVFGRFFWPLLLFGGLGGFGRGGGFGGGFGGGSGGFGGGGFSGGGGSFGGGGASGGW